jgi:hypothetical protein
MTRQAQLAYVVSHWFQLIEGLRASSKEFYASIEGGVKKREIPDALVSRVQFTERGFFSARREYLRVQRNEYVFDICAAPFGSGFFVSWWLSTPPGCLAAIPVLSLFARTSGASTYYGIDTMLMFQQSVHNTVLEVADGLIQIQGVRAIAEIDRRPIMRELYKR